MKKIKQLFTEQLLLFDFNKHSNGWYYRNSELIIVINMQKSNYEKLYFLNVGVWLNSINDNFDYPKENICHIRIRAERLFNSIPQIINPRELFDFNEPISEEKTQNIRIFLSEYFGPILNGLKSILSLRKLHKEDYFKYAYIEKNARAILSDNSLINN